MRHATSTTNELVRATRKEWFQKMHNLDYDNMTDEEKVQTTKSIFSQSTDYYKTSLSAQARDARLSEAGK